VHIACLYYGIQNNLLIASNCKYSNLIMNCNVIIHDTVIFNSFEHTYDDILFPKSIFCIYVLTEDGPRRPKHAGEIIMAKQIYMHEYLQLVAINTV